MIDSLEVAEKERLLATVRHSVCGQVPGCEVAVHELLDAIEKDLRAYHSGWCVTDNLGLAMRGIHRPVPAFDEQVGTPADQAFARLTVDRPVWRLNWSLSENPDLHQPAPQDAPSARRRFVRPLADALATPAQRQQAADVLRALPDALVRYKGLTDLVGPVLEWLNQGVG